MMVVDASAILAIILNEPERGEFLLALQRAGQAAISPVNLWEVLVKARIELGPKSDAAVNALLAQLNIVCEPMTGEDARVAAEAFARFGKRTPAKLNLGDCFPYALAKREGEGLLFKGDDFPHTDVKPVLADQG